jgi:subtilisin family serine protease
MPDVLSLSWGNQGEHNLGYIFSIVATDAIIAKMTAMGTTVVAASGDYDQFSVLDPYCGGKLTLWTAMFARSGLG